MCIQESRQVGKRDITSLVYFIHLHEMRQPLMKLSSFGIFETGLGIADHPRYSILYRCFEFIEGRRVGCFCSFKNITMGIENPKLRDTKHPDENNQHDYTGKNNGIIKKEHQEPDC